MKVWSVRVGRVVVAERKPVAESVELGKESPPEGTKGKSWDALGGLPDIYVELHGESGVARRTSTARNCLEHDFEEDLRVILDAGQGLRIRVMDEDFFGKDDLIGNTVVPITQENIAAGRIEARFGSVESLELTLDTNRPARMPPGGG